MSIWLVKFGLDSLLLLLMSRRLSKCRKVVYFERGILFTFCSLVLRCLKPGIQIKNAEYRIAKLRDDRGRIIRHEIEDQLADAIIRIQNDLAKMKLLQRCPWSRFPKVWVVRYLAHEIYQPLRLSVIAIHVFKKLAEERDLLLMCMPSLERHLKSDGLLDQPNVVVCGSKTATLMKVMNVPVAFAVVLGSALINLVLHLVTYRGLSKEKDNRELSKVGVQYCWGHDVHGTSDIYWFQNSGVKPQQVQFYFNRPDTPLTIAHIREFKELGFAKPISPCQLFNPNAIKQFFSAVPSSLRSSKTNHGLTKQYIWHPPAVMYWKVVWLSLVSLYFLGVSLLGSGRSYVAWAGIYTFKMVYNIYFWFYFFEENNIKVHMNHSGDCGNVHTAQTMAMDLTNGINVRATYSYAYVRDIHFSREFHVYFVWGPKPRCEMKMEEFYSSYLVCSGYIFDSLFREESAVKKFQTLEHCPLRVAVFDEALGWLTSFDQDSFCDFFNMLFRLAKGGGLGLYVKSKVYDKEELFQLCSGFSEADISDKMVFLSNRLRPYQALHHADLAVCMGINSAGIEAALYGTPTIYWGHEGYICEQLETTLESRLVFHRLEEIEDLLGRVLDDRSILKDLGDHREVIDEIDPFRDGQAGSRIGKYINSYLMGIDRNMSREEAIRNCNEEYRSLWGKDKVTSMSLESFRAAGKSSLQRQMHRFTGLFIKA